MIMLAIQLVTSAVMREAYLTATQPLGARMESTIGMSARFVETRRINHSIRTITLVIPRVTSAIT